MPTSRAKAGESTHRNSGPREVVLSDRSLGDAAPRMYPAPEILESEVFTRMPERLHRTGEYSAWVEARGAGPLHSFLEGPSFDRAGNLYAVDLAHGRIFRISATGEWSVFADYDGEPNGLRIHRDGRVFVADHRHGVLAFDPETAGRTTILGQAHRKGFKGLNDLVFGSNGDLFFTDQGQSALQKPDGRVYRLRQTGELDLLFDAIPGPNGLVLDPSETVLYVSATWSNQILGIPLKPGYGGVGPVRMFIQLSGSPTGPGRDGSRRRRQPRRGSRRLWHGVGFQRDGRTALPDPVGGGNADHQRGLRPSEPEDALRHRGRAGRHSQGRTAGGRAAPVRAFIARIPGGRSKRTASSTEPARGRPHRAASRISAA